METNRTAIITLESVTMHHLQAECCACPWAVVDGIETVLAEVGKHGRFHARGYRFDGAHYVADARGACKVQVERIEVAA